MEEGRETFFLLNPVENADEITEREREARHIVARPHRASISGMSAFRRAVLE